VPPAQEPIGLFVTRTAKALSRAFDEALAEHGSTLSGWLVLASLAGGSHQSQRSIATELGVEGPTLTHHLNRMEAAGLVTRTRDPANRRVHRVELTADGELLFGRLLAAVTEFDRQVRSGIGERQLGTLRRLLGPLRANPAPCS